MVMTFSKGILIWFSILMQLGICTPTKGEQWPADGTYQKTVLVHHNIHRKNHSAPRIEWSHDMVKSAKVLAQSCIWGHNTSIDGGGYGQNIAAGVQRSHVSEVITDLFYNQEMQNFKGLYGQASPDLTDFGSWGHFTQVVWKGTKKVGCSTSKCPHGMKDQATGDPLPYYSFTVCNYDPPGNYYGEFNVNIGRPNGMRVIGAQY